ncbi:MFS transporter [Acinetobacter nosocomialis]|uniref:MFS transporter n=1 Tax=Acinetobacter nosocomialis TaxID=106654 RepID=UPI001ADCFBD7|nr:MFS transporter [Acinetobacter nosocomialis]MBO8209919.1 MFS transporter [Acinetobacter nosocomialis]MBO8226498.1 MFS transporter [Acinetobacter nosocomialis]MBO8251776.1 MFS transporter [Acinetobacter nosocomialis]MDE3323003.1 MFS transporter [Acinetobacter nosocomialis]
MFRQQNLYLLLFSLYWAQGLPVGFMTHALPVILRAQGESLAHIGGFGLLMLPWSIKIFWAPWVDRHAISHLGHYRSWILPTQLLTVAVLCILSFFPIQALDQPLYLFIFFIALLFMNSTGATQDIATDALAVNLLQHDQQHWGNTFQVVGSRLGFIVGGGAVLWCLDWLSWQPTFLLLAALVFINTLPVLLFKEPPHASHSDNQSSQPNLLIKIKSYLSYFSQNKELRSWLMVLITFKVADGLAGPLLKPLMVDMGLSFTQIGVYITMLGAVAALVGAFIAGWVLKYFSRPATLISFLILKIMSLGAYVYLAYAYEQKIKINTWLIYSVNALEDAFAAMLLVVMLTLVMHYSRKNYAGTDFTFQVSIMATVSGGLYTLSGIIGDVLGYFHYLIAIVTIAVLFLIPIYVWKAAKAV